MTALSGPFLSGLLEEAGLRLPPESVEKLVRHGEEMLRWNRSIRLTAITEPEQVAVKHILDSLLLLHFAPFPGRTLDAGTGAGYPGIPLAIALPESRVLLLEPSAKKCAFLSRVCAILHLPNAKVFRGRIDAKGPPPLGVFEQIVTRATFPPHEAVPLLSPHLAAGGRLLVMTGPRGEGPEGPMEDAGEAAAPGAAAPARRLRFALPMGMGSREIREYLSRSS